MNLQKLMKQAQQMQEKMQRELAELEIEAAVGGGMVAVKMNGLKDLIAVHIDPEVLDSKDPAMLEDLILAAYREAGRQVDEAMRGRLGSMAGGLPGGLPGF
jgi:DNA-binding YbaB/EbfC family protein